MPTTTYSDAVFGVRNIGTRTDSSAVGVTDLSAEEDRYSQVVLTGGIVKPTNGYIPASGGAATWDVDFGSGTVKDDYAIVSGVNAGQGNYLVRLAAASEAVTIDPADGSNPRIDEVYLIIADAAYDGGSVALPRFGYRKGDAAASPAAPGADAAWDAYLLLASIALPAGVADIEACSITDERVASGITLGDGTVLGRVDDDFILSIGGVEEFGVSATTVSTKGNDLDTEGGDIVGTTVVGGTDLAAHESRHRPGGADAIATGTPSGSLTPDESNSEGTALTLARSDHQHNIPAATPITQAPDQSNSEGSASSFARSDHRHNIPAAAPNAIHRPDESNSEGSSTSFARSDHHHQIIAGSPASLGTVLAEGTGTSFARSDHVHRIQNARSVAITGGHHNDSSLPTIGIGTTGPGTALTFNSFSMPSGWNSALVIVSANVQWASMADGTQLCVQISIDGDFGTFAQSGQTESGDNVRVVNAVHSVVTSDATIGIEVGAWLIGSVGGTGKYCNYTYQVIRAS